MYMYVYVCIYMTKFNKIPITTLNPTPPTNNTNGSYGHHQDSYNNNNTITFMPPTPLAGSHHGGAVAGFGARSRWVVRASAWLFLVEVVGVILAVIDPHDNFLPRTNQPPTNTTKTTIAPSAPAPKATATTTPTPPTTPRASNTRWPAS